MTLEDLRETTGEECSHEKCEVSFDESLAKELSAEAVRKLWPRFEGECPDCGNRLIKYASFLHYICGDW